MTSIPTSFQQLLWNSINAPTLHISDHLIFESISNNDNLQTNHVFDVTPNDVEHNYLSVEDALILKKKNWEYQSTKNYFSAIHNGTSQFINPKRDITPIVEDTTLTAGDFSLDITWHDLQYILVFTHSPTE